MDNSTQGKFQITKGSPSLRFREILMDSDGLLTLVKLNFFFLITTFPVIPFLAFFTGGASITALLYCTNQLVRTGSVLQVRKTYFTVFKNYFKSSFPAGFIVALLNYTFIIGFVIYLTMASSDLVYIPLASISLLAIISVWAIILHFFPALTEEENEDKNFKELISISVSSVFIKLKKTLIAVVISFIIIFGIILMLPKTLPLFLVMIFSVPGLAAGFAHSDAEFISDII